MMLNQAKSLCYMKNVLCSVLEKYRCTGPHDPQLPSQPLCIQCEKHCTVLGCESRPVLQSIHESEQVTSLPESLALAHKMSMDMQTPTPQLQFWNFRTSENKFFRRFVCAIRPELRGGCLDSVPLHVNHRNISVFLCRQFSVFSPGNYPRLTWKCYIVCTKNISFLKIQKYSEPWSTPDNTIG